MNGNSVRLRALFPGEAELAAAIGRLQGTGVRVDEVYSPYPLPDLLAHTGQTRTRLPWVCFGLGLLGATFKIGFQFWTSAYDWPLNVGGKPWDSLPAYLPVTFEVMVLVAGLGAFGVFLGRRRLFPGKRSQNPYSGTSDHLFALRVDLTNAAGEFSSAVAILKEAGALAVDREPEGGLR